MSKFRHLAWLGLAAIMILLATGMNYENILFSYSEAKIFAILRDFFQLHSAAAGNSGSNPAETQGKGRFQREVAAYEVLEVSLTASVRARNPYRSGPALTLTFTGISGAAQGKTFTSAGFWYGDQIYRT